MAMTRTVENIRPLIVFLILTLGGGLLIGYLTAPGPWYDTLVKPAFNPPSWAFGPAWTILYFLIAIAGTRVWIRELDTPLRLWFAQLTFNFVWPPIFFGAQRPDLALAIIAALLVLILAFIAAVWKSDRVSALLFVPYAAWVGFASLLNLEFVRLN